MASAETALLVYITCADREEARRLAGAAVEARLAACGNILGEIESVYRWQGAIQRDPEVALLLKTQEKLFAPLAALITERHSYETPCIIAWPITHGHAPFLSWISAETEG